MPHWKAGSTMVKALPVTIQNSSRQQDVDISMTSATSLLPALRSYFGYDSFLPMQEEIIANVLERRDTLALMPTGGGKSLCYQLPALAQKGTTLVISPLIALMKDQVDGLEANGIAARYINSSLPTSEIRQVQERVRQGQVKILYVAPERLGTPGFNRFLQSLDLALIAIDEAHCISEWGHEFRPDYRNLRQLRQGFPSVPVVALTATATERVREDIVEQLDLETGRVFLSSFNRPNLAYSVRPKKDPWNQLLSLLKARQGQSAIIYCFSRQETEDLAESLKTQGLNALPYHAGLDGATRRRTQDDFIHDRVPIIVATIAFGMGIDKPDVRLVVHYSLPKSLESYYQETGRAGRDGLPSDCVLFYSHADKAKQEYFIKQIEDAHERRNAREKLAKMVGFAQSPVCRRRTILEYFGERWDADTCGGCDVCQESREHVDATEIAQKILSAVVRTGQRFGATHVIRVLTGSRDKRILDMGHDQLSVHGIAKDRSRDGLRDIIGRLQAEGLLASSHGEYPTLAVTGAGMEFLRKRQSLTLDLPKPPPSAQQTAPGEATKYDSHLFEELRTLRRRMADAQGIPPFVVFSDVSLRDMSAKFPLTMEQFSSVHGVGQAKLEQYGPAFLQAIKTYAESTGLPVATGASLMRQRSGQAAGIQGLPKRRRGATEEATNELLSQGMSVSQIAKERGLAETTIINHMERLQQRGVDLDVEHLLPDREALYEIGKAFEVCGSAQLKPVWEFLESRFTYDELRLARMHFRRQGTVPD